MATLLLISETRQIVAQASECHDYSFDTPFFPGGTCEDIYNANMQAHDRPGYYWTLQPDGPHRVYCGMNYTGLSCEDIYFNTDPVARDSLKSGYYRINNDEWVLCNMTNLTSTCLNVSGIWRRVAYFDTTAGDDCPAPWVKSSFNGISFCKAPSTAAGCYSVVYPTGGGYQKVCGRAVGYQKGSPDAFNTASDFDGLSITHGNPRQHIWAYAIGTTDFGPTANCPCAAHPGANPPAFVGSHYYCESGAGSSFNGNTYYLSDVVWDGAGCSTGNTCCSNSNLPWFYRQLSQTTQNDIEVRVCTDQNFDDEAVLITSLELHIQ